MMAAGAGSLTEELPSASMISVGRLQPAKHAAAPVTGPQQLFENDDGCGDYIVPVGNGLQLQTFNALSAGLFVLAGAQVVRSAETQVARAYGLMMCFVGVGSFSYHATSSLTGFLIDVVPMAVSAALMLNKALHALQADAGYRGTRVDTERFGVSAAAAFVAVYVPWVMMQFGASPYKVWGVWALLFGSMGTAFGLVSLLVLKQYGRLRGKNSRDLVMAVGMILVGLACTLHSFIPHLCSGVLTKFPFHALWHLCSSVTSNRTGHLLDAMTKLTTMIEQADAAQQRKRAPLLLRMVKDALPSQFSM